MSRIAFLLSCSESGSPGGDDPKRLERCFWFDHVASSIAQVGNDTDPYQINQTFSVPGNGYRGLTTLESPEIKLNSDLKPVADIPATDAIKLLFPFTDVSLSTSHRISTGRTIYF